MIKPWNETLYGAQTPQAAHFDVLLNALNYCYDNAVEVTDEASALEHLGYILALSPILF